METVTTDLKSPTPIGAIIPPSGDLHQRQRQKPIESTNDTSRLNSLPPLVIPQAHPDEIVGKYLGYDDLQTITEHLTNYQKSGAEWDHYRQKIKSTLLDKWRNVLIECRENGFIGPKVQNETIVWKQILGFKRNYKAADKCSLCSRTSKGGDCRGRAIYNKQGQMMFKPCWM